MLREYRHIISFLYCYFFVLVHIQVFFNLLFWELRFDVFVYDGSYVQVLLLFILLPLIIPYSIYQWLYLKKIRYRRRLLSVLFLEVIVLVEIVILLLLKNDNYKNRYTYVSNYTLFGLTGFVIAVIMGIFLDLLMKKLFKEDI